VESGINNATDKEEREYLKILESIFTGDEFRRKWVKKEVWINRESFSPHGVSFY
jgi:hypothetical protein